MDQDADGVADSEDCAPDDPSVFPGADEICDGVDQDCDGQVDEDAVDYGQWYVDADADSFGDADDSELACAPPAGSVADSSDCDDTNSAVYPGAPEICGDGVVNACGSAESGCRIEGEIMLSEGEILGNVQSSRCSLFADINGDGVLDASCGNASWVAGPITEGALRPQWLLERPIVGQSAIADVDGDGQVDLANRPPGVDEVEVYYGQPSVELEGRRDSRPACQPGWARKRTRTSDG